MFPILDANFIFFSHMTPASAGLGARGLSSVEDTGQAGVDEAG